MTSDDPGWQVQVDGPRCPYCHEALRGEDVKRGCGSCMAWHHAACLRENGGRCAACRAEVATPVDEPAPRFRPGSRLPALLDRYDPNRPERTAPGRGSGWVIAVLGLTFLVPLVIVMVGLLIPHASQVALMAAGAVALVIVAISAGRPEPGIRRGLGRWGRRRRQPGSAPAPSAPETPVPEQEPPPLQEKEKAG